MLLFLLRTKYVNLNRLVDDHNLDLFKILEEEKLVVNYKDLFKTACSKGHIEFVKWMFSKFSINIHLDCDYPFYYACLNGHLNIAKWIYSIEKKLIFMDNLKYIFCRSCEHGHLEVVKWLHQTFDIDIHALDEYAFRTACANNHLLIAQWLITIDKQIDISASNDYAFSTACTNGHLDMAKWILSLKPEISVTIEDNVIFRKSCYYGHLNVAKWLLTLISQDSLDKMDWDQLFSNVCSGNQYEVARWLVELRPNIDIAYEKHVNFVYAVEKGNQKMIEWIYQLDPECVYSVEAFITCCTQGHIQLSKWLNSFNQTWDDNIIQQAFISASKEGHLDIMKWLWSLNFQINVHVNEEFCFRSACEHGLFDMAIWIYETVPKVNIRAKQDYAFVKACKSHHKEIALWLTSLCPDYYLVVKDWMILEFRINNRLHIAQQHLIDGDYDKAINILGILTSPKTHDIVACYICQEVTPKIIETNCKHYFCLECLLSWYILKNATHNFPCAYCRSNFEWSGCYNICQIYFE